MIQHVKELKKETSVISETNLVPTESDELTVAFTEEEETGDGRFVIKASLCCEERSDLLPDMIKTLKAMRLKTLKAEITTVGGRVKNVLFVTGEENSGEELEEEYCIGTIEEALKAVMEKNNVEESSSSGNAKRQRMSSHNTITIVEQQHASNQIYRVISFSVYLWTMCVFLMVMQMEMLYVTLYYRYVCLCVYV